MRPIFYPCKYIRGKEFETAFTWSSYGVLPLTGLCTVSSVPTRESFLTFTSGMKRKTGMGRCVVSLMRRLIRKETGNMEMHFLFDAGFDQHIYKQHREFLPRTRDGKILSPCCFFGSGISDMITGSTGELSFQGGVKPVSTSIYWASSTGRITLNSTRGKNCNFSQLSSMGRRFKYS